MQKIPSFFPSSHRAPSLIGHTPVRPLRPTADKRLARTPPPRLAAPALHAPSPPPGTPPPSLARYPARSSGGASLPPLSLTMAAAGSGSAPPLVAICRPRTRPHHAGSARVAAARGGSGGRHADLRARRPARAACAGAAAGRDPPLRRASLLSDGEYGRQGPHATFPPHASSSAGPLIAAAPPRATRQRPWPARGEEPPVRVAMAARRPRRGPWRFGGSRFAARREGAGARRRGPRPPRRYCCCSRSPRMPTMMAAASRGRGGVASEGGGRGRGMEGVAAAGHGGRGRAPPQGARCATTEK